MHEIFATGHKLNTNESIYLEFHICSSTKDNYCSSVTDESFVDETRVWLKLQNFNDDTSVYDEFICVYLDNMLRPR